MNDCPICDVHETSNSILIAHVSEKHSIGVLLAHCLATKQKVKGFEETLAANNRRINEKTKLAETWKNKSADHLETIHSLKTELSAIRNTCDTCLGSGWFGSRHGPGHHHCHICNTRCGACSELHVFEATPHNEAICQASVRRGGVWQTCNWSDSSPIHISYHGADHTKCRKIEVLLADEVATWKKQAQTNAQTVNSLNTQLRETKGATPPRDSQTHNVINTRGPVSINTYQEFGVITPDGEVHQWGDTDRATAERRGDEQITRTRIEMYTDWTKVL